MNPESEWVPNHLCNERDGKKRRMTFWTRKQQRARDDKIINFFPGSLYQMKDTSYELEEEIIWSILARRFLRVLDTWWALLSIEQIGNSKDPSSQSFLLRKPKWAVSLARMSSIPEIQRSIGTTACSHWMTVSFIQWDLVPCQFISGFLE